MERIITIPNRNKEGWFYGITNVKVNWECPICGAIMGEPTLKGYCEDGEFYYVDNWTNPCGHLIRYCDLMPQEVLPLYYRKPLKV